MWGLCNRCLILYVLLWPLANFIGIALSCDIAQPKVLRKTITNYFRQFANLDEHSCMFKFVDLLSRYYRLDAETFQCSIGVGVLHA